MASKSSHLTTTSRDFGGHAKSRKALDVLVRRILRRKKTACGAISPPHTAIQTKKPKSGSPEREPPTAEIHKWVALTRSANYLTR